MTVIRRPSPFREMVALRSSLDRLFDESSFPRPFFAPSDDAGMPFDIRMTLGSDGAATDAPAQPAGHEPTRA